MPHYTPGTARYTPREQMGLHLMLPSDNPDPDQPGNNPEDTHFGVVVGAVGSDLLIWRLDGRKGVVILDNADVYADCGAQATPEEVNRIYIPQVTAWLRDRGVDPDRMNMIEVTDAILALAERQGYVGSPAWRWHVKNQDRRATPS